MRHVLLMIGFVAGACTTAAVQSSATQPPSVARAPATVISLSDAPQRRSPPGTATVAVLARGENAFLARLEMQSGAIVPEHRDATEEYIHVLEGQGTLHIDGQAHEIVAGTTVYMPAHAEVSFRNGDARMVAIQVFAGPEPADKYQAWSPVSD